MRILVFSDSHGRHDLMYAAWLDHPEADMIVHLGDYERDVEELADVFDGLRVEQVCGNCDYSSFLPANKIISCGETKILITHGHREYVKHGTEMLKEKAKSLGVRIVLYGHTHQKVTEYENGMYVFNPGALCDGRYGLVDITPNGIICIPVEMA